MMFLVIDLGGTKIAAAALDMYTGELSGHTLIPATHTKAHLLLSTGSHRSWSRSARVRRVGSEPAGN